MSEIEQLKKQIQENTLFIEGLIKELGEAYDSVEVIKENVTAMTQDFKCLLEAMKK